jgi:hypothetical protein
VPSLGCGLLMGLLRLLQGPKDRESRPERYLGGSHAVDEPREGPTSTTFAHTDDKQERHDTSPGGSDRFMLT